MVTGHVVSVSFAHEDRHPTPVHVLQLSFRNLLRSTSLRTKSHRRSPMRISYVLLVVAATTLLASGTMATTSGHTTLPTMESPDAVSSLGAGTGGAKRLLRYHTNNNRKEEDELDGEERAKGANLFASWKLDEMVQGTKRIKRFKNWKAYGYNPVKIRHLNKLDDYDKLYQKYRVWFYHHSD